MSAKKLIALCACPMGLAHTFMAAEAIEVEARKRGYEVKVETQGADGIQNELTPADIAEATVIIHATGITPQNLERFNGYAVYDVELKDAVKDAGSLIDEIEQDQAQ
ncbi:enzyme IIB component of PTS [Enterobacterales bacterium]|nr:enzyme IIB component of PTS [Enterobacterales bacterium]